MVYLTSGQIGWRKLDPSWASLRLDLPKLDISEFGKLERIHKPIVWLNVFSSKKGTNLSNEDLENLKVGKFIYIDLAKIRSYTKKDLTEGLSISTNILHVHSKNSPITDVNLIIEDGTITSYNENTNRYVFNMIHVVGAGEIKVTVVPLWITNNVSPEFYLGKNVTVIGKVSYKTLSISNELCLICDQIIIK